MPPQDGRNADQRLFDIAFQHTFAHRRFGFIENAEQTGFFVFGVHRLCQFQIPSGTVVHPQELFFTVEFNAVDPFQSAHLRQLQIAQQHTRCGNRLRFDLTEFFQFFRMKLCEQSCFAVGIRKVGIVRHGNGRIEVIADKFAEGAERYGIAADQYFRRGILCQLVLDLTFLRIAFENRSEKFACGNIAERSPRFIVFGIDRTDKVIAARIEHQRFHDRAGRNDTDNLTLDKSFRGGRVFDLFADTDLIAL